jgi:acyl-[acyl carrier protein]--UDP-N-acetylglucosamine O-acyltransferase
MSEEYGHIPDGFLLNPEEVEELRKQKHELTEYGKEKLRKLIYEQDMKKMEEAAKDLVLNNLTLDEMIDEAARRERSNRILERYNNFYNLECSGLSHGTAITPEFQQAMTLECMLDTLRCENLNREYNEIAIVDIEDLIERLYQQGKDYLERVRTVQEQAQGHSKTDLDAL